jgi:putative transposase
MARLARTVVAGLPHHVTQRGNRREAIFFEDGDQEVYRDLLAEQTRKAGVEVWAYCLMPNHVHLILTPTRAEGLGLAVGEAHRRYTNFINARGRWTGHLFQSRFASVAMDELHLLAAISYVSLNPVRAGLAGNAADWAWSSVRAHLAGKDDGLVTVRPVLDRVSSFADLLLEDRDEAFAALRRAESTGRPVGTAEFVTGLERVLGRRIARRAPGPAPAASVSAKQLKLLQ